MLAATTQAAHALSLFSRMGTAMERYQWLVGEGGEGGLPLERIRVLARGERRLDPKIFHCVGGAVLARQRLEFNYRARTTDADTRRHVSPQRLTRYRDNWYLDAWDHDREALRSFAVDRIRAPQVQAQAALDVAEAELEARLAAGYGIFAGPPKGWATIHFSAHAARWVADEHWHPEQQGERLADGRYALKVPYANAKELLMDVLKYGPDAEIIAPLALREEMKILLRLALAGYG